MDPTELTIWIVVWLVTALFLAVRHWRHDRGVGLLLSYIVSMGAIHWLSSAFHLAPWYFTRWEHLVTHGMRLSALALVALAVGSEAMLWFLARREREYANVSDEWDPIEVNPAVVNLYLASGLFIHIVLLPIARGIASLGAVVATGSTLIVVALALKCWNAWQRNDSKALWGWLAASAAFPFVTVVTQGFLGYGMAAMLSVVAFVAAFLGPRPKVMALFVVLGYLGLSVYVTYMRDRQDIRNVVWSGGGVTRGAGLVRNAIENFEWFDPRDSRHFDRIDDRLNQNLLVGASVEYLRSEAVPFAHGATMIDALLALVPRALWPDKNTIAGSGSLVSDYTGLTFGENTSVGVGHVMEAYINFALPGLLIGFFIFGAVLTLIDRVSFLALSGGDPSRFLLWYLPGLGLLQVGGSFVEATSTAAAAWVVAMALNWVAIYVPHHHRPESDAELESEAPEVVQ